jgi:hypothetical protein
MSASLMLASTPVARASAAAPRRAASAAAAALPAPASAARLSAAQCATFGARGVLAQRAGCRCAAAASLAARVPRSLARVARE